MKSQKSIFFLLVIVMLESCASGYKVINPASLNYQSQSIDKVVSFDYKYDVLSNRYAKKELKNGIKLVAVKVTNNAERDLVFGKDIKLSYTNNTAPVVVESAQVYAELKQGVAIYLLYLLLTPATLNSSSNGAQTSSVPVGYAIGPGLSLGNMIAANSANSNFHKELLQYDLAGTIIKKGQTIYGLIGIRSGSPEALKIITQ
jgi:hypothetical protein